MQQSGSPSPMEAEAACKHARGVSTAEGIDSAVLVAALGVELETATDAEIAERVRALQLRRRSAPY